MQCILDCVLYKGPGWKPESRAVHGDDSKTDFFLRKSSTVDFQHAFRKELKDESLCPFDNSLEIQVRWLKLI